MGYLESCRPTKPRRDIDRGGLCRAGPGTHGRGFGPLPKRCRMRSRKTGRRVRGCDGGHRFAGRRGIGCHGRSLPSISRSRGRMGGDRKPDGARQGMGTRRAGFRLCHADPAFSEALRPARFGLAVSGTTGRSSRPLPAGHSLGSRGARSVVQAGLGAARTAAIPTAQPRLIGGPCRYGRISRRRRPILALSFRTWAISPAPSRPMDALSL